MRERMNRREFLRRVAYTVGGLPLAGILGGCAGEVLEAYQSNQPEFCGEAEKPALVGIVRNPEGEPLIGVKVVAEADFDCPPTKKRTEWTTEEAVFTHMSPDGEWDENKLYPVFPKGYFQVPGSFEGSYKVRFEAEGYQSKIMEINLSCGEEQRQDVVLTPAQ